MSDKDYEVGYCKTPVHTRFKPGQSGNREGRPKGCLNLKTHLIRTLSERITVTEGPKSRRVNKLNALVLSLTAKGIKGDPRAAAFILNLVQQTLTEEPTQDQSEQLSSEDEAILNEFLKRTAEIEPKTKSLTRARTRNKKGAKRK